MMGEHVQAFVFASPFIARRVRIRPLDSGDSELLCLRLELIGGRLLDILSPPNNNNNNSYTGNNNTGDTSNNSYTGEWLESESVYVSMTSYHTAVQWNTHTVSSLQQCYDVCLDYSSWCTAVRYVPLNDSLQCVVYDDMASKNYIIIKRQESTMDMIHILLKLNNNPSPSHVSSHPIYHVSEPGILTSVNYPYHYVTGSVTAWHISLESGYIQLLFSNISLNVYKEIYWYTKPTPDCVADQIVIAANSTLVDPIAVVNASWNGQKPVIRTSLTSMVVVFRSCLREANVIFSGNGFRAILREDVLPTCSSYFGDSYQVVPLECSHQQANLVSSSFDGIPLAGLVSEHWYITSSDGRSNVILKVHDFYVGCWTGSLYIDVQGERKRHCNINRPVGELISQHDYMRVSFVSTYGQSPTSRSDFFFATYRIETYNSYVLDFVDVQDITDIEYAYPGYRVRSKVCSSRFSKCYASYVGDKPSDVSEYMNWNQANEFCEDQNGTLVSIMSQTELHIVMYLHELRPYRFHSGLLGTVIAYMNTYIGLRREETYVEGRWTNGRGVIYQAWMPGEPKPDEWCTVMSINYIHTDMTWESVECRTSETATFVCQTPFGPQPECSDYQFRCDDGRCIHVSAWCDKVKDCSMGEDEHCELRNCSVLEMTCSNGQCIHYDFRCDSKLDCFDGSDEADCSFCSNTTWKCKYEDETCIPLDRHCDTLNDCLYGVDEFECDTRIGFCDPGTFCDARMGSCLEVWESGFRQSGTYHIPSEAVCEFQPTDNGLLVFTGLYWFDIVDAYYTGALFQEPYPDMFMFSDWDFYREYLHTNNCTQIIQQSCDPNMAIIDQIDGMAAHNHDENYRHVDHTRCMCLMLLINNRNPDNRTSVEPCLTYFGFIGTDMNLQDRLLFSINDTFPVGLLSKNVEGPLENYIRVMPGPLMCHREFDTSEVSEKIACGSGIYAPVFTKCLYDHDAYGYVVGCRNLAHLLDCETFACPEGYVKCPDSFCLAWQFLCDGRNHCLDGEDELDCRDDSDIICPNGYRCRGSKTCIHTTMLCDGHSHCPQHDDERLCNFTCPMRCDCVGLTVDCSDGRFEDLTWYNVSNVTRILTLRRNQHVFDSYSSQREIDLPFLVRLDVSHCTLGIIIPTGIFDSMVSLQKLTFRHTDITVLGDGLFLYQSKLTELDFSFSTQLASIEPNAFRGLVNLRILSITGSRIHTLFMGTFSDLAVEKLDISNNLIETVEDFAFKNLQVDSLHIENNLILSYSDAMFSAMVHAQFIYTDAYAFCCIRPIFVTEENCFPHRDEFSSCEDLIRKEALRAFLWIVCLTSLLGNVLSLVYILIWDTSKLKLGYGIFVTNLAISDFMMGVYLIIIGIADVVFRGSYMTEDIWWRNSHGCTLAGVFATISSEASIFLMCLITVDRLLVIKYPFGEVKFTTRSALIASAVCWILSIAIAMFPIWHSTYFKGRFYNEASVCLALPLTRDRPPGWAYSITIFVGFNFLTFCLISFGQWMIYNEITKSKSGLRNSKNRAVDLRVTRNLLLVVTTDFLCWFPIGVMGIMGWNGTVIPPNIYAWTAIFILPINAAINPILYTLLSIIRKKSFAPRSDEQAAKIHVETANTVLSFWNSNRFVGPFTYNLLPLSVALRRQSLTAVSILRPALVLTRCLDRMHTKGFVARNLTMDDILYVKRKRLVLKLKPMVANRDSQKADDIRTMGQIVHNLLRMYDQRDGDKL